ncbi:unnamed protein product [Pedinophyceae sp. YPF-701]|nr:unnamed protein product [Pedinophyceae sp. YPF-701]
MAAMVHPEAHEQPSGKVLTFADPDAAPGNYPETQMDRVQMTLLIMSWIQLLLGCTLPVLDIAIELKARPHRPTRPPHPPPRPTSHTSHSRAGAAERRRRGPPPAPPPTRVGPT